MNASKSVFVLRTIFRRILFEFLIGLYALVATCFWNHVRLIDVQKIRLSDQKCITSLKESTLLKYYVKSARSLTKSWSSFQGYTHSIGQI